MTALRDLAIGLVCALLGWLGCLWWHGLLIPSGTVAEQTQATGEQFIAADRAIGTETEKVTEVRTRWLERKVEVPADCPPGTGPVSESARLSLADALQAAEGAK